MIYQIILLYRKVNLAQIMKLDQVSSTKVGDSFYILTNAHVVTKEKQKVTYSNNKSVEGKVIGKDKWSDIAVVKAKISTTVSKLLRWEIQII